MRVDENVDEEKLRAFTHRNGIIKAMAKRYTEKINDLKDRIGHLDNVGFRKASLNKQVSYAEMIKNKNLMEFDEYEKNMRKRRERQ